LSKKLLIVLTLVFAGISLQAQDDFYDPGSVREIRIRFTEPRWRTILDSLFTHVGEEGRLIGTVDIDGTTFDGCGIRYKGYSSYNADEVKNPFNIDLDYLHDNRNYQGHSKIKLSNVINDPSFVREALSYEIAADYLPVSRANFARVFVNDTLIGLYTNVEAVDKKFVALRYGSDDHAFFKGDPETLHYPFGDNANLAYDHGSDSSGYYPYYKIESDDGWTELLDLIIRLDSGAAAVAPVLNIDRALWMHALNFTLLNLDSYIGYCQNFYIYRDENGQFNPIPWDLNMSFGSFRDSDGSYHFQGLTIDQMKTLDPLEHVNFSVSTRPLMTTFFDIDRYRKMFLAHIRTIVSDHLSSGRYYERAAALQDIIDPWVEEDTNKFYSYQDFKDNLTMTVGGTGGMLEYPGLKDLMEARVSYLSSYPGFTGAPSVTAGVPFPAIPVKGDTVWMTATVEGGDSVFMGYRHSGGGVFASTAMFDDGNHRDGLAGDGVFGIMIPVTGEVIQYYFYAENDSAGVFLPSRAAYDYFSIQTEIAPGDIVINEVSATGEEDWIEIFNTTGEALNLTGAMLTADTLETGGTFVFPDTVIASKGYLVVYAGDDTTGLHAGVTPGFEGFSLTLSNSSGHVIDTVSGGLQVAGKTIGRYPNGWGSLTYMQPTPCAHNAFGTTPEKGFLLYPVPASEKVCLELRSAGMPLFYRVFDALGRQVMSGAFSPASLTDATVYSLDVSTLRKGFYLLELTGNHEVVTHKLIIE